MKKTQMNLGSHFLQIRQRMILFWKRSEVLSSTTSIFCFAMKMPQLRETSKNVFDECFRYCTVHSYIIYYRTNMDFT